MRKAIRTRIPPRAVTLQPRRGMRWLLVLLLVLGAARAAHWAWNQLHDSQVGFAAPTDPRVTDERCVMTLIDESSSMVDSDPRGTRSSAVRATARFFDQYGLPGDRVGVGWFADQQHIVAPSRPDGLLDLAELSGQPPMVGGGTVIAPALTAAIDALDSCGTARPVLILITDGESDPGDLELAASELAAYGQRGAVHLVAMNGGGSYAANRDFWEGRSLGLDSIREIDSFDRDPVAAAIADILSLETGQRIRPD